MKTLNSHNPDKIFLPHWSYIISKEIFTSYECIVFHMTDLPFGRGGSPLALKITAQRTGVIIGENMAEAFQIVRNIN